MKEGWGIFKCASGIKKGDVYQGEWRDDMKHGDGIYKHANRTMIEGSFYDNEPD